MKLHRLILMISLLMITFQPAFAPPCGGGTCSRSFTETELLSDSMSRQTSFNRQITDSITLSDTELTHLVSSRLQTDNIILNDQIITQSIFIRSLTDSIILADSTFIQGVFNVSLNDITTLDDQTTIQSSFTRTINDNITLDEQLITQSVFFKDLLDSIELIDNIDTNGIFSISLIDYTESSDEIFTQSAFFVDLIEFVELSDETNTETIFIILIDESLDLDDNIMVDNTPAPQSFAVDMDDMIMINDDILTSNSSPPQNFQVDLIELILISDDLTADNSPIISSGIFDIQIDETIITSDMLEVNGIIITPQMALIKHKGFPLDKTPPTLGVNNKGERFIIGGFTINEVSINAEYFYTPMNLQVLKVGINNTVILKIYENNGAKAVERAIFCINIPFDGYVSDTTPCLIWKNSFDGKQSISTIGSDIFSSVSANGQVTSYNIMIVTINFVVDQPQPPAKFGTSISDRSGNTWQNYFNDGIKVIENSSLITKEIFVKVQQPNLPDPPHVMYRNYDYFTDYKSVQEKKALETITEMYGKGIFQSFEYKFKNGTYTYHERNMTKLHQKMLKEEIKAVKLMKNKTLNLQ